MRDVSRGTEASPHPSYQVYASHDDAGFQLAVIRSGFVGGCFESRSHWWTIQRGVVALLGFGRRDIASPEQIARRLPVDFPDDETVRISHEAIYQALFV